MAEAAAEAAEAEGGRNIRDGPTSREGNKMKKSIVGYLFNRIENLGNKKYNHIGCEGEDKSFGDFLASFVPKIDMRQKVRFTIETFD